jgi:hypothetical protein
MITVKKIQGKDDSWYEVHLIHPLTKVQVMESDGFHTLDEVAQFLSDTASAILDSYLPPGDIKEKMQVTE